MMTDVAVILPVHRADHPGHFAEAIDSTLCQLDATSRLIIVCDGPLNDIQEACLPEEDARVDLIRLKENRGLAAALNAGILHGRQLGYSYIARMDADDRMLPGRLSVQTAFLDENPTVDILGCAIREIDEDGELRGKTIVYPATHEQCRQFFRFRDPVAHPAVMFRAAVFDTIGMYNEAFRKNQDTELWYRAFLADRRFANLQETWLEFRMTGDFFRERRGGIRRARQLFRLRREINRGMGYGLNAQLLNAASFILSTLPSGMRRFAYRVFR